MDRLSDLNGTPLRPRPADQHLAPPDRGPTAGRPAAGSTRSTTVGHQRSSSVGHTAGGTRLV